ncbi:MAG: LytTR family DNA-binding domain-containing protein [Bacteroidota bacterium]
MEITKQQTQKSFKDQFGRLFFISFGVFLFILFFQPFPLEMLDYNNRLLYVLGFGGITFVISCIVLIFLPFFLPKWFKANEWESGPPFILSAFLLILTSTAFAFYIRFVGQNDLSLYILFKLVLVCLIPIFILVMLYKNKSQERIIEILREQNKTYFSIIQKNEKNGGDQAINIFSSNKSDKITLKPKNIILIKSADNYIEIYYLESDAVEKKIVRNTLKDIEQQLNDQKNIIRCHRTSLVNMVYIEKLIRSYSGYSLVVSELDEKVPVSRQYLVPVKSILSTLK